MRGGEVVLRGADLAEWAITGKLHGRPRPGGINLVLSAAPPRLMRNALDTQQGAAGGFLERQDVRERLEYALAAFASVRQVATVVREELSAAQDLLLPTVNLSGKEGFLLPPGGAVPSEPGITFGAKGLGTPKFASGLTKVPFELLRDSPLLAGELGNVLGELIARGQNPYLISGTGTGQPLGALTAAPVAVTTLAQTTFTFDEVWALVASVPQPYRDSESAAFICSDGTLEYLMTRKDGQGRYLWKASGLDRWPVVTNIDMPEIGTGKKPLLFGDWSRFLIRDVGGVRLHRLEERERESDQDALLAFLFTDATLLDAGTGPIQCLQMAT